MTRRRSATVGDLTVLHTQAIEKAMGLCYEIQSTLPVDGKQCNQRIHTRYLVKSLF